MYKKIDKYIPYLYILPLIIVVVAVIFYPILSLFYGSLTTKTSSGVSFAGLQNFQLLFKDPLFTTAITNNLKLFLTVPILTVMSLVLSTILFNRVRGWQTYRSLIFIPYILSISVVGIIFSYILQYNGIINTFLRDIGLGKWALDWLGDPDLAMGTIAVVVIWKQLGFGVILFLARMQSIDVQLYEAAAIDGTNAFQRLIHITIPQAKAIIEFYIITTLIEMLSWMFSYVYVMTAGGPGSSTYILEYLLYKKAFGGGNYHIAQAVGVIVLLIAMAIIIVQQLLAREEDDE